MGVIWSCLHQGWSLNTCKETLFCKYHRAFFYYFVWKGPWKESKAGDAQSFLCTFAKWEEPGSYPAAENTPKRGGGGHFFFPSNREYFLRPCIHLDRVGREFLWQLAWRPFSVQWVQMVEFWSFAWWVNMKQRKRTPLAEVKQRLQQIKPTLLGLQTMPPPVFPLHCHLLLPSYLLPPAAFPFSRRFISITSDLLIMCNRGVSLSSLVQ